ncbi:MAG: rhodanese-like domain-containing protein [Gammaproteobacteria bacterium]|jgi:rhodanese-related sulfurtransferase
MKQFFLILLIISLAACEQDELNWVDVNAEIEKTFPTVEHISVSELKTKDLKDVLLVDVRKDEEFAVSHIPGAVNLEEPLDIAELASQSDKHVIVYCSVGYRSAAVVSELNKLGVSNATNLKGSIFEWANKDLPLINKAGSTREVHPYDEYWGQLLD